MWSIQPTKHTLIRRTQAVSLRSNLSFSSLNTKWNLHISSLEQMRTKFWLLQHWNTKPVQTLSHLTSRSKRIDFAKRVGSMANHQWLIKAFNRVTLARLKGTLVSTATQLSFWQRSRIVSHLAQSWLSTLHHQKVKHPYTTRHSR